VRRARAAWPLAAAGLALAVPAAAGAQAVEQVEAESPVAMAPLAPGEVLVEIYAVATVLTPADVAVITTEVVQPGATGQAARSAAEAEVRRLEEVARAAGAAADDVESAPVTLGSRIVSAFDPEGPEYAHGEVVIRLAGIGRVGAVEDAINRPEVSNVSSTHYLLADSGAAWDQARRQALAAARADAEAYAAMLGLRVLRVVRVTERLRSDVSLLNPAFGTNMDHVSRPEIETIAGLGVDFALGPR
jgi:uncharacterized protein YggE